MVTVYDIANFFVDIQRDQPDSDMTFEKLQMLVYYAQGFSLAILGHPLFSEELFAYEYGLHVLSCAKVRKRLRNNLRKF